MTDKLQRGISAQTLLENEIFRETMNTLDGFYTAAWRDAKTLEAREDCYRYVKLIERLIADIQSVATTGKIEQARQNELEGKRKSWLTAIK